MNYLQFTKAAAKITKTASKSRPILTGVNHTEEYVCATDSHRLIYATGIYEGAPKVEDVATGAIIDGNYPDVSRLIPGEDDYTIIAELNVKDTLKVLKTIKDASNAIKVDRNAVDIVFIEMGTTALFRTHSSSPVQVTYQTPAVLRCKEEVTVALNVKYAIEMFEAFKDVVETVKFNVTSDTRPVTVTAGNALYLTLPIRINKEESE